MLKSYYSGGFCSEGASWPAVYLGTVHRDQCLKLKGLGKLGRSLQVGEAEARIGVLKELT